MHDCDDVAFALLSFIRLRSRMISSRLLEVLPLVGSYDPVPISIVELPLNQPENFPITVEAIWHGLSGRLVKIKLKSVQTGIDLWKEKHVLKRFDADLILQ